MQQQFYDDSDFDLGLELAQTFNAHFRLLADAEQWAQSNQAWAPVNLDVFALIVATVEHHNPTVGVTYWNRVMVASYFFLVPDFCRNVLQCPVPRDLYIQFENFLNFLFETDWLDDCSDRIQALLQPFGCHLERDYSTGELRALGGIECLCFKPFRGHSHGRTMSGRRA